MTLLLLLWHSTLLGLNYQQHQKRWAYLMGKAFRQFFNNDYFNRKLLPGKDVTLR